LLHGHVLGHELVIERGRGRSARHAGGNVMTGVLPSHASEVLPTFMRPSSKSVPGFAHERHAMPPHIATRLSIHASTPAQKDAFG
jgi:hypothetical protein